MSVDHKELVKGGYDTIALPYQKWAENQPTPRERYTTSVLKSLPPGPRILELGCASGVPITRMLLDNGAQVVANDISTKQLELARERCPEATATFVPGDMSALQFEPESFDGVVSFFAIFHLPRAEQKGMLIKIHTWLKDGKQFAFNLATKDAAEIRNKFFETDMFWSSFSVDDSKAMIREAGFEIIEAEVLEAGDGNLDESDPDHGITFLWVLAKKGGADK